MKRMILSKMLLGLLVVCASNFTHVFATDATDLKNLSTDLDKLASACVSAANYSKKDVKTFLTATKKDAKKQTTVVKELDKKIKAAPKSVSETDAITHFTGLYDQLLVLSKMAVEVKK